MWKQPISNCLDPARRTQRASLANMSATAVIAVAAGWSVAVSCLLLAIIFARLFA